jgi:hypothetical protein
VEVDAVVELIVVVVLEAVELLVVVVLVVPTAMGEWDYFGYFKDSEGNLMGLFQTHARATA